MTGGALNMGPAAATAEGELVGSELWPEWPAAAESELGHYVALWKEEERKREYRYRE